MNYIYIVGQVQTKYLMCALEKGHVTSWGITFFLLYASRPNVFLHNMRELIIWLI